MSGLAKRTVGDLTKYDPVKAAENIAILTAAEKHFAKAKDATQLRAAIEKKLERQAEFVQWWDTQAGKLAGRPAKKRNGSVTLSPKAAENGLPDRMTISRWRRRLGTDEAFAATLEAALTRYVRVLEFHAGHTRGVGLSLAEEWYTPAKYLDAARKALGAIDLDPASSKAAMNFCSPNIGSERTPAEQWPYAASRHDRTAPHHVHRRASSAQVRGHCAPARERRHPAVRAHVERRSTVHAGDCRALRRAAAPGAEAMSAPAKKPLPPELQSAVDRVFHVAPPETASRGGLVVLDLDAPQPRGALVRIRGTECYLRRANTFAPLEARQLVRSSARIDELIQKREELTQDEQDELKRLPDQVVRMILEAPAKILKGLTDEARMLLITTFLESSARP